MNRIRLYLLLLTAALGLFGCRTAPPLPTGVLQRTERITLAGRAVDVDLFLPQGIRTAPVAVIAHGFSRNRQSMSGWGTALATNGILAAVPDLPAWADHERNGRAVGELLARLQAGTLAAQPAPSGRAALVGFSAGGLASLLAAATATNVHCWVGLDPVDMGGKGVRAARQLRLPCLVLRAEPSACNADGNSRSLVAALNAPLLTLLVKQGTHCDPENPTDWLCGLPCGSASPARQAVFGRYLVAGLRAVLLDDARAREFLGAATNDPAVGEVTSRNLQDFRRRSPVSGRVEGGGGKEDYERR